MARLRYNGLSGTLGASLTNSATTLTFASKLTHVGGDVPTISGSDYIPLSILDANGKCAEVVYVTAYTTAGTTATISRGKEGTSGVAHDNGRTFVNGGLIADFAPARSVVYDRLGAVSSVDDEFDDESLTGWTQVDAAGESGYVTWTESRGVLSLLNTGQDATAEYHGLMKSLALAVGDYIETHVRVLCHVNLPVVGLAVTDGTTHGAGTQCLGIYYFDGSTWRTDIRSNTNWTTSGSSGTGQNGWGATPQVPGPFGTGIHMRIVRSATSTWQHHLSADGVTWLLVNQLSLSLTPTHVGLVTSSYNTTPDFTASFSYFRSGTA